MGSVLCDRVKNNRIKVDAEPVSRLAQPKLEASVLTAGFNQAESANSHHELMQPCSPRQNTYDEYLPTANRPEIHTTCISS